MATVTGMTAEYLETRLGEKVDTTALPELVDDRVSTLLVQGEGVTLDYDDTGNTLTISSSGGGGGSFTVGGATRADSALTTENMTMGGQPVQKITPTATTFTDLARGGVAGPEFIQSATEPGDFAPAVSGWYMVRVHAALQWPAGAPNGIHWLIITSSDNFNVVRPTIADHPAYTGGETATYRDEFVIGPIYISDGVADEYDQQFSWNITVPGNVAPSYVGTGAVYFDFVQVFPATSTASSPGRGVTRASAGGYDAFGGMLVFKNWTFDGTYNHSAELTANAPDLDLQSSGYNFRPAVSGFYVLTLWLELHATTDWGQISVEWVGGSSSMYAGLKQQVSVSQNPNGSNVYYCGLNLGPVYIDGTDDPADYWPIGLVVRTSPTSVTPATSSWQCWIDVWGGM